MLLTKFFAALRRWMLYRATVAELSNLNDRELDDLGIARGDIAAIAHDSAYGH